MNRESNSPKSNLNGHNQHLHRLKHIHLQLAQRSRFFFFFLMAPPTWNPPHKLMFIEDAKKSLVDRPRM